MEASATGLASQSVAFDSVNISASNFCPTAHLLGSISTPSKYCFKIFSTCPIFKSCSGKISVYLSILSSPIYCESLSVLLSDHSVYSPSNLIRITFFYQKNRICPNFWFLPSVRDHQEPIGPADALAWPEVSTCIRRIKAGPILKQSLTGKLRYVCILVLTHPADTHPSSQKCRLSMLVTWKQNVSLSSHSLCFPTMFRTNHHELLVTPSQTILQAAKRLPPITTVTFRRFPALRQVSR